MNSFPMSVANNLCDKLLPEYLDSKTVLIYCPHPVEAYKVPTLNFRYLERRNAAYRKL
jgi:hypothetical protein